MRRRVKKVLAVLRDDVSQMPKNWNRRFKYNREKIKTGDIYELAEVVRNLAIREFEKGLSTGEKQMYTRAKKILASELMYALEMDEDEAEEHLKELMGRAHRAHRRRRRRSSDPSDGGRRDHPGAGSGERLGADGPKAFVVCAGRELWEWSPDVLASTCDRVVVAVPAGYVRRPGSRARRRVASESVRNALAAAPDATIVVVITTRRGRSSRRSWCARASRRRGRADGAIAATPVTDTVKEADPDGRVRATLDRSRLWSIQTPQAFRADALRRALDPARRWPRRPTTRC